MSDIYFHSWLTKHKYPFGAIQQDQSCTFRLWVTSPAISHVKMMIRKEDGPNGEEAYLLEKTDGDYLSFTYTFDQGKGLYFYYFTFEERQPNGTVVIKYYAPLKQGGQGQVYQDNAGMPAYQLTCFEKAESPPAWYRESIFYQIFPDRFYNGNPNGQLNAVKPNTFLYATTNDDPMYIKDEAGDIIRWDFYGGNLQGIIQKIPYLKELGVNALYLNPIFEAASNHRYDTGDYDKIDSMLGDEEIFTQLVDQLHQAGIRVILDGVFSHVGRNSRYFNYDGSYGKNQGAYQNQASPYYSWFNFDHYPDEYKSWWGIKDLPEMDKTNASFQSFIHGKENSVLTKWNRLGIDGWRIDVADELPDTFLQGVRNNLNQWDDKLLIGEVWEDASNKIAYDQRRQYILGDHLHGVMNYPFRDQLLRLLNLQTTPQEVCETLMQLQENYPEDVFYNGFNNIGTHDTERILTLLGGDMAKLKLAFGFLFMSPGTPCIYYGDEAGLTGGSDPDNRKFFPWENINETIFQACQAWIDQRKQNRCLTHGEFLTCYTKSLFGILRYLDDRYVLYVINPHPEQIELRIQEVKTATGDFPFRSVLLEPVVLPAHSGYFVTSKNIA
ncbi:glycoside hydrolase family 13 protein [Gracilibacillus phocaeensis]|uniref:glycoside hydrolase family 13 protein n=1 Tax=Gracilibacillus phocaeensis TaxID=2042304 RepID=UPI00103064C8|nr:glycoside hydrolase family 13 protein [Gracilibacillus phocaeensis]